MIEKSKILIVDDSKIDQLIIQEILKDYNTTSVYDGTEAIDVLSSGENIDMIILDLNMPKMNGFEVLERIRSDFSELEMSVIILTNYEEIENEIRGLELGAVDYVRKPLNTESLLKRIEVHLNLIIARKEVKEYNTFLEERVRVRTNQLVKSRDVTVNALIGLLEVRDIESSNHTKRTQLMMKFFTEHLSTTDKYKDLMKPPYVEALYKTAPLHDIGKVGIKDEILLKPGKLTEEEFRVMKAHVKYGVDALTKEYSSGTMDDFISTAVKIISAHHEKYDGTGYPANISGSDIPIEGRLMAIIDVYDALTSKRVYKEEFTHEYALSVLKDERGKHFDPFLVNEFLKIEKDIQKIAIQFKSRK